MEISNISKYKFISITFGIIVLFWVFESAVHILLFNEASIAEQVAHFFDPTKVWLRLLYFTILALPALIWLQFLLRNAKHKSIISKAHAFYKKYKMVAISIPVIVFFWMLESITHAFVFKSDTFIEELFIQNLAPHEIWMRLTVVVVILITMLIILHLFSKKRHYSKKLTQSQQITNDQLKITQVLNELLAISHENISLKMILDKALTLILKLPFAEILPKGAIFLSDHDGNLSMISQKELGKFIENKCAFVPSGTCHCGMAAKTKKPQYSSCVDKRHSNTYNGISQHGHYNVPILINDVLLGVINIYLPAGHKKADYEISILQSVAHTLALIINRKEAEAHLKENEKKFRSVVETAKDAIIIADDKGKIISWNKSAEKIFGYSPKEVLGRPLDIIMPKKYIEKHKKGFANQLSSKKSTLTSNTIELEGRRKNKEVFPLEMSLTNWEFNGRRYFCSILRDVSDRKQAETDLVNKNQELETFMYKSSHDMKGPLSSVLGLVNVAHMNVTDEEGLTYLNLISSAINKMERVLNDLTKVSQIKQSAIDIAAVDFNKLLKNVIDRYKFTPHFKDIKINIENKVNGDFKSDRIMIDTILGNLLENSIKYQKYNSQQSYVKINIRLFNGYLKIKFDDNGVGIPKKHIEKIFDMFFRANEHSKGTGLGLYIVKNAVEKLGGSIKISSQLKKGTITNILLPINKREIKGSGKVAHSVQITK